ncbi:MAG: hypothetical protein QOF48_3223 [Verrucomicrobiota bacterium]|jgi:hypothetical protein
MFTRPPACLAALVALTAFSAGAAEKIFDFNASKIGAIPAGFASRVAGSGQPGDWQVIEIEVTSLLSPFLAGSKPTLQQRALAQLSRDKTDEHAPLLVFEDEIFADFSLTTRFKIVEGEVEQMAGIAFGIQDEKNFSYVRASALAGTLAMFRVVSGIRTAPIAIKAPVSRGEWHELRVEWKDKRIRAVLDGKFSLPEQEEKVDHSGKIGFWTKSDSVSYFGETRIVYRPKITLAQTLVQEALRKYPRLLDLQIFAGSITNDADMHVIGSKESAEIGRPAPKGARDVVAGKGFYYGKDRESVLVMMPLHDWNGDTVAAVKVLMKTFPGQTEKSAFARATPILKDMAGRVQSAKALIE